MFPPGTLAAFAFQSGVNPREHLSQGFVSIPVYLNTVGRHDHLILRASAVQNY